MEKIVVKNVFIKDKMEHAIYLRDLKNLYLLDNHKFGRIYFGNEFCEKLIPEIKEVKEILEFIKTRKISLTIVTPDVSDNAIKSLCAIFSILPKKTEIVFNSWGILKIIEDFGMTPVMGRLLVSMKKDPTKKVKSVKSNYFSNSNLNGLLFQEFIIKKGIKRIELDNTLQIHRLKLPKKLQTSLYYPYVQIATARKCFSKLAQNNKKIFTYHPCSFECENQIVSTKIADYEKEVLIKGNTQFYINNIKPNHYNDTNTTRLIYMPELPFCAPLSFKWNAYHKKHPKDAAWGTEKPDRHIVDFIEFYKFGKNTSILDSGCGSGKNSSFFIKKGFNTSGIDISEEAIKFCRYKNPRGKFSVQDAVNLSFDYSFDVICDAGCLHVNFPFKQKKILEQYHKKLKKRGKLFIRLFSDESGSKKPVFYVENLPVFGFTKEAAIKLIENKFAIDKIIFEKNYGPKGVYFFYLIKK